MHAAAGPADSRPQCGSMTRVPRDGADHRPGCRSDDSASAGAFGGFGRRAARRLARQFLAFGEVARQGVPVHVPAGIRSEEHTSELQSPCNLVCRLLLEKKKKTM